MPKFSIGTFEEVQKLVKEFRKTGDQKVYAEIHRRFEGFFNSQAQEIGGLFGWVAARHEIHEYLESLFNETLLNYNFGKVNFVTYSTKYIKTRARGHFKKKLNEAILTRPLSEDLAEADIVNITSSITDVRKQILLFNAARECNFTARTALVLGALLLGKKEVEIAKYLKTSRSTINGIKYKAVAKLKEVLQG